MESDLTEVDIAIINWNTSTEAVRAARAYAQSEGVEARVTLFDNASTPDQRRLLNDAGEYAVLVESGENLGFGRAANAALSRGDAEYILVSNADILPEAGAVAGLIRAFKSRSGAGLIGAVLEETPGYHDRLPGPATLVIRTVFARFNSRGFPQLARGMIVEVDQPAGACFLTSRRIWEEVGGFDEAFFLWYEDVDLAKRTRDLGYSNLVAGDARVSHLGGRSFSRVDDDALDIQRVESLHLYARRHHPLAARMIGLISSPVLALRRFARRHFRRIPNQDEGRTNE